MTERHLHPVPHDEEPPEDPYAAPAPPHDAHAEVVVLGAMLRDRDAIADVWDTLTGADFHSPRHEQIYEAITTAYARLEPVDTLTIADRLEKQGNLARCGGHAYLHHLTQQVLITANAGYYADIIREKATRRRLDAAGLAIRQLAATAAETSLHDLHAKATAALDDVIRIVPGVDTDTTHPWAPVDFGAILDGDLTAPSATVLTRRDGKHLLYPYAVHSIAGEPGSLKTWVALLAVVQELEAGNSCALIDFEDRGEAVAARLLQIGASPEHLRDPQRWRYVRPETALDAAGTAHLDQAVADCTLVIVDGVTEAMSIHGMSVNDNDDVARFVHLLPRRIANQGPAVLQIDHVTKDSETRGRYAIGGQHKLAAITGTAMKALVVRSGGKGEHGVVKVVLDKDKHGDVGPAGTTIAEFHLDDTQPGQSYAWLDHPTASVDEDGHFRPTILMKRVSDYLLAVPRAASLREIRQGVKGNAASIAQAVDALIREGHIRVENGPRGAVMHHLVTAFEDPS